MAPLILVMLDGIAADYVARHPARVPNLTALSERGVSVARLAPDLPATSLPGRTSILTGVDAATHGVYGNLIWDGSRFRHANPDDVTAPTLTGVATDAGLDVAAIGYGMVRPEEARTFHHAWWAGEMLQRARDQEPIPADEGWLRTSRHVDASGRLAAAAAAGLPADVPDAYAGDRLHYLLSELTGDASMMQWTAALATGDDPPDLIVTEVLAPDTFQHVAGYEHAFAHWSITYADLLIGHLLGALEAAGRLAATTLLVTSDHGHGPIERAWYADVLLPGRTVASEGGVLYVAVEGRSDAERLARHVAAHDITALPGDHLPHAARDSVAAFVTPGATTFETRAPEARAGTPHGPSLYRSGHGFTPGTRSDDRFLVVAGPGIARRRVERAESADVAATAAAILGVQLDASGTSLV